MHKLLYIFIALVLSSCNDSKVKSIIDGLWSIDSKSIIYKRIDISGCILGNTIYFGDNCRLPVTHDYCSELTTSYDETGTYELIPHDNGYKIKFDTENELFSDQEFDVFFDKDEEKSFLKMILVSDSLWLKCTKASFNYEGNKDLVEELIRITPS